MATLSKLGTLPSLDLPQLGFGLYIDGTDLNDTLYGTAYADEIHGRLGSDVLYGGAGDDLLFGEEGNDTLYGGVGNDILSGGAGNDVLAGGAGADTLIGGDGFDTASYASSSTSVYVNLATNTGAFGDAQGDTFSGIDKVIGSNFADGLFADDSGVVLEGGAGDDLLLGGAGLDVLNGGSGADTLEGGLGLDILTGGSGTDYFVFNRGDGPDLVTDFQSGVDKIVLRDGFSSYYQGVFGADSELMTGTEVPTHMRIGGYARDVLFYDTDDHQLYELSRASWSPYGEVDATLLATFSNGVQLHTSDFILG
jgi:Ca2+-binding RTX toxin-like protein